MLLRHHTSDPITNDLPAFRQGKAWKRFPVCILDFNSHKTRSGGRVVDLQVIAGEAKWFRDHFASSVRSIYRDKSVCAESEPLDVSRWVIGIVVWVGDIDSMDEYRDLAASGRNDTNKWAIGVRSPVLVTDAGTNKRLHE